MSLTQSVEILTTSVVVPLEDRRQRIIARFEACAVDIGAELIAAKAEHPGKFIAWVEAELPFGIDKAERLMAITRAFANPDPEIRAALPLAHTCLFELTRLPHERLRQAIEAGDVHPDMTVREAQALRDPEPYPIPPVEPSPASEPRIAADVLARELLRFPREQLSHDMANQLSVWLG